jgi:hypothetical protein
LKHNGEVSEAERAEGKQPSTWAVMAHEPQVLEPFAIGPGWQPLRGDREGGLWTDNYSNVLRVLRW